MSIGSLKTIPVLEQPDLLGVIFSFFEDPKELTNVGSVNKRFNKIARENIFWLKIAERINYLIVLTKGVNVYLQIRAFIKEIKKEVRCCRFLPKNECLDRIIEDSNAPTIQEIEFLAKYRTTMDIIAVWKSLAFSAGLIKPVFDHISRVKDLFKRASQFSYWFEEHKEQLYHFPHCPSIVLRYGIRILPKKIWQLNKLRLLDLMHNKLRTLSGVEQFTQLESLCVANNRLVSIKEILSLTQLKHLYVDGNQLTSVEGIGKLNQLETLNLDNNLLETIPSEVEQLTQLKTLSYKNNPLDELPIEIAKMTQLNKLAP